MNPEYDLLCTKYVKSVWNLHSTNGQSDIFEDFILSFIANEESCTLTDAHYQISNVLIKHKQKRKPWITCTMCAKSLDATEIITMSFLVIYEWLNYFS